MMKTGLAKVLLVAMATLIGLLLSEAGYRVFLYASEPYRFLGDRNLWYFQASPYRFSAQFGFEYNPGSYAGGAAYDGRVIACWDRMEEWEINALGNSGRIKGSYPEAQLKVLAFGDSYTQRPRLAPNGEFMTWPDYLQDLLERELGLSVNVVNFGRDAYGVLQMFDLAEAKAQEWKPDLVIIAFITDDLTRGRFWRTTTFFDGRPRIMTSLTPDSTPDWNTATDAYLLEPRATLRWCRAALQSGVVDDPIVQDLERALRQGRRHSTVLANPFSLRQSFVVDRILRGDAFFSTYAAARPSQLPRHELADFGHDARLKAAVGRLNASEVPYAVVHLATYSEIAKGEEYAGAGSPRALELVGSLERLIGQPVRGTLEQLAFPVAGLDSVPVSSRDEHPSLRGHQFYAERVLELLKHAGLFDRVISRSRARAPNPAP